MITTRRTKYRILPESATEFTASASLSLGAGAGFTLVEGGGQSVLIDLPRGIMGVVDSLLFLADPPSGIPTVFFSVRFGSGGPVNAPGFESIAIPGVGSDFVLSLDTDIEVKTDDIIAVFARNADVAAHEVAAVIHGFMWPQDHALVVEGR